MSDDNSVMPTLPVVVAADEVSPGVKSMYRRLMPGIVRTGKLMVAAGVALSGGMLWLDRYELIPVAVALIVGGPGLIGGALGFKAWQAQAEK